VGVGGYVVQLAAALGGHVTATGRAADGDFILGLGAERFADAATAPSALADDRYDIVIDTVGGAALAASCALVRPGGRPVTIGAPPSAELANQHGVHGMFFVVEPDRHELAILADMTADGRLHAMVSQTFPLRDGQRAFCSGRARPPGKTVLLVR